MARDTITLGENAAMRGRYCSVEMREEPLVHELDEAALAAGPAAAIRDAIGAGIRAITTPARGGKHPLFNRTGHLARDLVLERQPDGSYAVMPPADRLQDRELLERLVELVPAISDPLSPPRVQEAIAASLTKITK